MDNLLQLTSTKKGQIKVESFAGTRTTTWLLHTEMDSQEFLDTVADILAIVNPEEFHQAMQQHSGYNDFAEDPGDWPDDLEDVDLEAPGGGSQPTTHIGMGVDLTSRGDPYASIPPPAGFDPS